MWVCPDPLLSSLSLHLLLLEDSSNLHPEKRGRGVKKDKKGRKNKRCDIPRSRNSGCALLRTHLYSQHFHSLSCSSTVVGEGSASSRRRGDTGKDTCVNLSQLVSPIVKSWCTPPDLIKISLPRRSLARNGRGGEEKGRREGTGRSTRTTGLVRSRARKGSLRRHY